MKLAVTQIVLGALVVVTSVSTSAYYFPTLVPVVPTDTAPDFMRGFWEAMTDYYEGHWFVIYGWMVLLVLLGLTVLGCGIAQHRKQKAGSNDMRLSFTQTILGVLIMAAAFVNIVWYQGILFPNNIVLPDGRHVLGLQSLEHIRVFIVWNIGLLLIGLAIFGSSIVQFIRARRTETAVVGELEIDVKSREVNV